VAADGRQAPRHRPHESLRVSPVGAVYGGRETADRDLPLLGLIGVLLAVSALAGPWWTASASETVVGLGEVRRSDVDLGLFGGSQRISSSPAVSPLFADRATDYALLPEVRALFLGAAVFAALSATCGSLASAITVARSPRFRSRRVALLLWAVASASAAAAAILVATGLPDALVSSGVTAERIPGFWGSVSSPAGVDTVTTSWGAGWGWYAVVGAAGSFLAQAIARWRKSAHSSRASTSR